MLKKGKTVVVKSVKLCTSPFSKAKGLMFSKPITDKCLIFVMDEPRRIDLHMFFVFFSIDVLFLDDEKKIVEMKENFRPFTFYISKSESKYVIELPSGTIKNKRLELNGKLSF